MSFREAQFFLGRNPSLSCIWQQWGKAQSALTIRWLRKLCISLMEPSERCDSTSVPALDFQSSRLTEQLQFYNQKKKKIYFPLHTLLQNNSVEHTEVIGHLYGNVLSIFNIWLNKIHLCKQTQDEALTKKPNKQENHRLPHSQVVGLNWLTHPFGQQQPHLPRGGVWLYTFPLPEQLDHTVSPPRERSWLKRNWCKRRRKSSPKIF